MVKYVKASSNAIIEDENFSLVNTGGINIYDQAWAGLAVRTKRGSLADKHVIEIRLDRSSHTDFSEGVRNYKYTGAYVAHGMRNKVDSLDDTREYISVLESAVEFAEIVDDWMRDNGYLGD